MTLNIENKDIHKKKVAENNNFNVIVVWDTETFKENVDIICNYYKNIKK